MSSKGRRPNQNNDGHRATTNNGTRSNKSIIPQTSSPGHPPSPTDHQRNINNANIASNFFFQSPQCNKDNNNHNDNSSNNAAQGAGRAPESAANNFHSVVPLQDIASLYGENATIQVSMRGSNPSFFFVRQTNNNKAGMKQNNPSVAERRRQQNSRLNSSHSDLASFQSPTAKLQAGELSSLSNRDNGINQVAERIKRENSLAVKEYLANITDGNVRDEPMARLLMAQIQNNDLQLLYGTVAATPGGVWGDHCENEHAGLQMHHHQQQQQLSRRQQQLQQESQSQKRHVLMKRISDQLDEKITNGLPLTPLDHLTMTHINQYLEQQERQFLQHIQERQNAGSNISYSQLLSSRHQDHWAPRIRQMGMDDDDAPILSQLQRAQSMLERGECRVQQNDIRNESLSLEQLNKSDNKMDSKPSIKKSESLQSGLTVPDGNNHEKHAAALKVSPLKFRKEKRNAIKRSEDAVNMTERNKKSDEPKKKKAKIRKSGCYDLSCLPVVDKSGEEECDDSLNEEINNQSENIKYPLVNTPDASIESRDDDNHKSIILNHVTKPTDASKNPNHDDALISPRHIFTKALLSQSIQKHNTSQMNDFNKQKLINKAQATESVGDAEKSECDGERSIAQYGFCEQLVSPLHNNLNQKVSKAMDTSRYSNIHPDEFAPGPELAARFCQSEPKESYDSSESIRTQLQNCGLAVQRRMFTAAQKEGKDDLEADPNHQVHFSSSKSHACLGLLQLNCSNLLEHDSPNQATKSIDALGESEGNCPRQDSLSREFRDDSKYIALSLQESDEAIQSTMREDEANRFGDDAYKLTHRPERDSPLSDLEREISYGNSKTTDTYCQREPGFDSEDINTTKELPSSSASLESGLAPLELNDVIKSIEDENLRMTIEEDKKKLEFKLLERRVFYDRQITIMNSRLEVYDKLEGLAERISAIRSSNQPKRKKPGAKTPVHDMAIDMLHLAWQNYRMLESTVDRLLDLDDSDKFS